MSRRILGKGRRPRRSKIILGTLGRSGEGEQRNGGPESKESDGRSTNECPHPWGIVIWATRPLMAARLIGGEEEYPLRGCWLGVWPGRKRVRDQLICDTLLVAALNSSPLVIRARDLAEIHPVFWGSVGRATIKNRWVPCKWRVRAVVLRI